MSEKLSKSDNPLVSIVIPVYNTEAFLEKIKAEIRDRV